MSDTTPSSRACASCRPPPSPMRWIGSGIVGQCLGIAPLDPRFRLARARVHAALSADRPGRTRQRRRLHRRRAARRHRRPRQRRAPGLHGLGRHPDRRLAPPRRRRHRDSRRVSRRAARARSGLSDLFARPLHAHRQGPRRGGEPGRADFAGRDPGPPGRHPGRRRRRHAGHSRACANQRSSTWRAKSKRPSKPSSAKQPKASGWTRRARRSATTSLQTWPSTSRGQQAPCRLPLAPTITPRPQRRQREHAGRRF